jgi:hypothetical protein
MWKKLLQSIQSAIKSDCQVQTEAGETAENERRRKKQQKEEEEVGHGRKESAEDGRNIFYKNFLIHHLS